jgi:hypothetical protein
MNDRIKLAEAMGWTKVKPYRDDIYGLRPGTGASDSLWLECCLQVPDPFIDANDDYAVLEWINSHAAFSFREPYWNAMTHRIWSYKVGDYARAALKVLP